MSVSENAGPSASPGSRSRAFGRVESAAPSARPAGSGTTASDRSSPTRRRSSVVEPRVREHRAAERDRLADRRCDRTVSAAASRTTCASRQVKLAASARRAFCTRTFSDVASARLPASDPPTRVTSPDSRSSSTRDAVSPSCQRNRRGQLVLKLRLAADAQPIERSKRIARRRRRARAPAGAAADDERDRRRDRAASAEARRRRVTNDAIAARIRAAHEHRVRSRRTPPPAPRRRGARRSRTGNDLGRRRRQTTQDRPPRSSPSRRHRRRPRLARYRRGSGPPRCRQASTACVGNPPVCA